mgnify:FL=1|jgi:phage protein U
MIIGNWGLGLIFQTSDRRIFTPENLKRETSSVWATHSRLHQKDESEFIRPGLGQITFDIQLNAELGVRPRLMMDYINHCVETGEVQMLVIGFRRVGKHRWKITKASTAYEVVLNRGEIVKAKMTLTMEEYL